MLSRIIRECTRRFSGSDPFWTHLEAQPDKYPQYAHLHWTTMDLLEIGKYAKLRKEKFSDHISEDPAPIDMLPFTSECTQLADRTRDSIFELFLKQKREFRNFIDQIPVDRDETTYGDTARHHILAILKPKQIEDATKFAASLIEEYKAAGVPYTSQAVRRRVTTFLFDSLSKHQVEDLHHSTEAMRVAFGGGNPLNLD